MSKGGGTTSTVDPRILSLLNQNYGRSEQVFNPTNTGALFNSYMNQQGTGPAGYGEFVAPPSANTQLGGAIVSGDWGYPGAMNVGADAAQSAESGATGLLGYRPAPVTAPTLTPAHTFSGASINRSDIANINPQAGLGGLDAYMNPYTNDVIDTSLSDLNRARQLGINQNASAATLSNAFGGDRQALTDAETNRAYLDAAGRTIAGLRNQGFDTATGLLQNDQAKNLQAQLANQGVDVNVAGANTGYGQQANMFNAGATTQNEQFGADLLSRLGIANQNADLSGAGLDLSSAGLLGNLSNSDLSRYLGGAGAISTLGSAEDARQQTLRNAYYQEFLRQQGLPFQAQQMLNQSLGLIPAANGTQSYTMPNYTAGSQNFANFGQGVNSFASAGKAK